MFDWLMFMIILILQLLVLAAYASRQQSSFRQPSSRPVKNRVIEDDEIVSSIMERALERRRDIIAKNADNTSKPVKTPIVSADPFRGRGSGSGIYFGTAMSRRYRVV